MQTENSEQPQGGTIKAQSVSLPKGGGALVGMGETVRPNPFNGTASFSIPIRTAPCRNSEPTLSLDYASTRGAGIFGLGFGLSTPSIIRRTSKGIPRYDSSDVFVFRGKWLTAVAGGTTTRSAGGKAYTVTRYQPQREEAFERIEHWVGADASHDFWRVTDRNNDVMLFGRTAAARIADPEHPERVFEWLLETRVGSRGDVASYAYKQENADNVSDAPCERNRRRTANRYPERIRYGNDAPIACGDGLDAALAAALWHFEVVFDYGEYDLSAGNDTPYRPVGKWAARPDPFSTYTAGFERRTHRLCRTIMMFHRFPDSFGAEPALVNAIAFAHDQSPHLSLLAGAVTRGYRYRPDQPPGKRYDIRDKPALRLDYTRFQPTSPEREFIPLEGNDGHPPTGMRRSPDYTLVDLHGEGLPGILYADGQTVFYRAPELRTGTDGAPVAYGPPIPPGAFPIDRRIDGTDVALVDVAGNGRMAMVCTGAARQGVFLTRPEGGWHPFRPFKTFPSDYSTPGFEFADLANDGRMDLVVIAPNVVRYYPSEGTSGYGAARTRLQDAGVPPKNAARPTDVIGFADVLGSGSRQRVRVADGVVECWPNLGYGRFGDKVQLAGTPLLGPETDARRIQFADIDGSGTADLVIVYADRVEIHQNQSGNSFAAVPLVVKLPRPLRSPDQVTFADLLGTGAQCLVFTDDAPAPRQWCYDFCPDGKPYLLQGADNGLGASIVIGYASSTAFYLRDKAAGQPWVTRLPFPVQVVETIEHHDQIAQRVTKTRYSYRDGYFDSTDREFQGFAMVERRDWESGADLPDGTTTLTRTWYCVGAWHEAGALAHRMAEDRWKGDAGERPTPPPAFDWPDGKEPDAETVRQAHGTLAGTMLREEAFGLDGEAAAPGTPVSVTQYGQGARCLQVAPDGGDGIFFPHQRESMTYTYEGACDPAKPDPRVVHDLTLERDERGNVLRSARIAYPRRIRAPDADDQQFLLRALCCLKSYEPAQDAPTVLLFGLEQDERRFELSGLTLPPGQLAFGFDQAAAAIDQALAGARLRDWRRWRWLKNDGVPVPQKLLQGTEKAAFDADDLAAMFAKVAVPGGLDAFLTGTGGYVRDGKLWWAGGSTETYHGAEAFFLPKSTQDPFASLAGGKTGCLTRYGYDTCNLLLKTVAVTAAAGDVAEERTTATRLDYRTLQPQQITDANGVVREAITDALGEVVATSRYGQELVGGTARRVGFDPLPLDGSWPTPATTDDLIAAPATFLRGAETFHFRDFDGWRRRGEPALAVTLSASEYPDPATGTALPVEIAVAHTDGEGRALQKAQLVPPGSAWLYQPDAPLRPGQAATRWQISLRELRGREKRVLRTYAPFFLDTWRAIADSLLAPAIPAQTRAYDASARVVRTDLPKGGMANAFFTRAVYTAWRRDDYDADDTVKDSQYYRTYIEHGGELPPLEKEALIKAAAFNDTPSSECLDQFGRAIRQIGRLAPDGTPDTKPLISTIRLDILGRKIAMSDPRLGPAGHDTVDAVYALNGAAVKATSVDTGPRRELKDIADKTILIADARGTIVVNAYDGRHRLSTATVFDAGAAAGRVAEWVVYGDSLDAAGRPVHDPAGRNLAGQVCLRYDGAGLVAHPCYGIAGKALQSSRRVTADPTRDPDWRTDSTGEWAARFAALEPQIDGESFASYDRFNGAGRVVEHGNEAGESLRTAYDVAGRTRRLAVKPADGGAERVYLGDASYDPRGRRLTTTMCGDDGAALLVTTYEYDPGTLLLTRQTTTRASDGKVMQKLHYVHDPVGNVTHIENGSDAVRTGPAAGQPVSPDGDYTFDALYRLIEARGRAHLALAKASLADGRYDSVFQVGRSLDDATAVERYVAGYRYDGGGNLKEMNYSAGVANGGTRWTRTMRISDTSNRAVDGDDFSGPIDDAFDANGNQIWLTGSRRLAWDYRNTLRQLTIVDRGAGEAPDAQYFAYDDTTRRVRKTTRRKVGTDTDVRETLYFDGLEITRITRAGRLVQAYHRTRLVDAESCLAECLTWAAETPPVGAASPQVRFQLSDRQTTAITEVDTQGRLLSHEEYCPYGGTVFALGPSLVEASLKRYRYGGKERDPVTGLAYFGARHYAPWLARWLSPDPAGTADGLNLYAYARDNPVTLGDPDGRETKSPDSPKQTFFRRVLSRLRSSETESDSSQEGGEQSSSSDETSPPTSESEESTTLSVRSRPTVGTTGSIRRRWIDFWNDRGGWTQTVGGPLGRQLGIFPVYNSNITNNDLPGTWAFRDTQAHESVHQFVFRHVGIVSWLQDRRLGPIPIGAPMLHIEETVAYAVGHAAALRLYAIPFAPFEAFASMTPGQSLVTGALMAGAGVLVGGPVGVALGTVALAGLAWNWYNH